MKRLTHRWTATAAGVALELLLIQPVLVDRKNPRVLSPIPAPAEVEQILRKS